MNQPRSRTAFRQSGCQARGWDRTTPVTGARAEALPGYMILVVPPAQATLPWVSHTPHRSPHNSVRDLVAPQPALRRPQANCRPVKTCWWEEPLSSLPPTCRHRNVGGGGARIELGPVWISIPAAHQAFLTYYVLCTEEREDEKKQAGRRRLRQPYPEADTGTGLSP